MGSLLYEKALLGEHCDAGALISADGGKHAGKPSLQPGRRRPV